MLVGMWMSTELITVEPEDLLADAARTLSRRSIRRLPVLTAVHGDAKLVGILSASDVLHAAPRPVNPFSAIGAEAISSRDERPLRVRDVMTANPITTTFDAPIESAAAVMRERKIGALPVLRHGALVGLITESDIFRAFTSIFAAPSVGARITFDISQGEDMLPLIAALSGKYALRVTSLISLHACERPVCVVHVAGKSIDAMLEDLWKSHHRVESVIRWLDGVAHPSTS
jgi:acetoin utilization protein AcuB